MDNYNTKLNFVQRICPHPNHFCNGKHIPEIVRNRDVNRTIDLKNHCDYYINGMCSHPQKFKRKEIK